MGGKVFVNSVNWDEFLEVITCSLFKLRGKAFYHFFWMKVEMVVMMN